MGGSSPTTGWNYRLVWHDGLGKGPWDALTEFRGADKTAWRGRVEANTSVEVYAPLLWGGDKDQGGVHGRLSPMFGAAGQVPHSALVSVFGPRTSAHRGMMSVVWIGIWGANNPFAQKRSYRGERTYAGWDDGDCWYAAKVRVPIAATSIVTTVINPDVVLDSLYTSVDGSGGGFDFAVPPDATIIIELGPSSNGWSFTPSDDYQPENYAYRVWWNHFGVANLDDPGVGGGIFWSDRYETAAEAYAAHAVDQVEIPALAGGNYRLYLRDAEVDDNRGVGSFRVSFSRPMSRIAKNPAHMILYAHTQRHNGRQPRDTVNLGHLTTQADWFYSRGFGLCTVRNPKEESPREFIKRVEKVAGCSFTKSLADGLWYLDIANGVYDLESLPIITDDDVLKFKETATVSDNVVNSVSVKYFDPERNESVITPPVRAMGLIAQFGEIHQTFEYLEIPIGRIALEVAMRELLARITPTRAFELDTRPTVYALRKNQYVRLQLPKRGIADMVCLIADIPTSGKLKSGAYQLTLTQDIYSLPTTSYEVELGEDTSPPATPAEIADQRVFEAPYIDVVANMPAADFAALPDDAGYVVGTAVDPGRMRDFTLMVAPGGGAYDDAGDGQFCPSCTSAGLVEPGLQVGIGYNDASRMASVAVGDLALWDEELVRVDAIDLDAATLDLGRGCGDTTPKQHLAASRLFFYQSTAAFDPTQHIAGETLDVKLLTNSWSQRQDIDDATAQPVTMAERLARPYPQAKMEINGVSIFAIGTSTPGGGGGGGGGGGSLPTTPPGIAPTGAPASPTPGPNGGFPDDAPYPIPEPSVFGADVIGSGDFTATDSLDSWRDRLGSPLAGDWVVVGGKAQFTGSLGTAYGYAWRMSQSPQPFPRYSITVTARVQTTGDMTARVGVAWGTNTSPAPGADVPNYIEADAAACYATETTVSYTWELQRMFEAVTANLGYAHVNFMPVMQFSELNGAIEVGKADDVTMEISELAVPTTPIALDHLDFDAGLAGWDVWPDPANPYAPTVSASGGELSMFPTSALALFANVYCADPITATVADAVGKYIEITAEVWCDDPTVDFRRQTTGGAHMYLAPNTTTDGYFRNSVFVAQRGDWTLRKWWFRIATVPHESLLSYHVCAQMKCGLGYEVKVRNITAAITDQVMD